MYLETVTDGVDRSWLVQRTGRFVEESSLVDLVFVMVESTFLVVESDKCLSFFLDLVLYPNNAA